MKFFKKVRDFFRRPKEQGLIITPGLPHIDARTPLVTAPKPYVIPNMPKSTASVIATAAQEKVSKSCTVCKFAMHDPNLTDTRTVICTVDPNKPKMTPTDDTCLHHESKYPGLKVIIDKGTLLEYDSEGNDPTKERTNTKIIGEKEWQ